MYVWHDVVGAEARVILNLTDEAARVANARITEGRTLLSPDTIEHALTPLDLLVGDVVYCDAGAVLIDHIITWPADEDRFNPERRVASAWGNILSTFPGGPTTRWTDLTPADFDTTAEPGALFDLDHPSQVRPDPKAGTADLFDLLTGE
jgi:hypothetical protein